MGVAVGWSAGSRQSRKGLGSAMYGLQADLARKLGASYRARLIFNALIAPPPLPGVCGWGQILHQETLG